MLCTSWFLALPTGRTRLFHSQFLVQNFCFLAGFMHLSYHFLNWRRKSVLLRPLFFLLHFSELLLTFFLYLTLWLQNLFVHVTDKSRLSSHNSPGGTVGVCVYIPRKTNPYLNYFLFFPLSILYWPLQWDKCRVQGAAHTRTGLLYQLYHLHSMCQSRKLTFKHGQFFNKRLCFCINSLGHGRKENTLGQDSPNFGVRLSKILPRSPCRKAPHSQEHYFEGITYSWTVEYWPEKPQSNHCTLSIGMLLIWIDRVFYKQM